MLQLIEANWLAVILGAAILVAIAFWLFAKGSQGTVRERRPDVLDEGAAPARRNQALIDAPPAATYADNPAAGLLGGVGEVIAAAVQEETARAGASESPVLSEQPVLPEVPTLDAAHAPADDLTRIKGLGPKLSALLATLGVTRFDQIAAWTDADLARIDSQLGSFAGRPSRDKWVEQARLLAAGDTSGYEGKFGKL